MSRSRRYTPIISYTCGSNSEKYDKRIANRDFRRSNKALINCNLNSDDLEDIILYNKLEEVSDVYDFQKDGKQYLSKSSEYFEDKYMRK